MAKIAKLWCRSDVVDDHAAQASFAKVAPSDLTATVAVTAITLLVLNNMLSKTTLAIVVGGRQSGPMLMLPLIVGAIVMLTMI